MARLPPVVRIALYCALLRLASVPSSAGKGFASQKRALEADLMRELAAVQAQLGGGKELTTTDGTKHNTGCALSTAYAVIQPFGIEGFSALSECSWLILE